LEAQGKVKKKISERTRRSVYYVPEEWKQEVRILIEKREMKENIDKLTLEEFAELKEEFYNTFIR